MDNIKFIISGAISFFIMVVFIALCKGYLMTFWLLILALLVLIASFFIVSFIMFWCEATKDPDVVIASKLNMPIGRYKQYREWYDEFLRLMEEHGTKSKIAYDYFMSFFPKIKNLNEWRRYQDFRAQMDNERWRAYLKDEFGEDMD